MIRWSKIRSVAAFEFLSAIKRKGYLIATFGMPLFLLLYGGVISIPTYFAEKKRAQTKVYGVVDHPRLLGLEQDVARSVVDQLPPEVRESLDSTGQGRAVDLVLGRFGSIVFRPFASEDAARAALAAEAIKAYYVLPPDFLETGVVEGYFPDELALESKGARGPLREMVLDKLLEGRVSGPVAERVRKPVAELREWTVGTDGQIVERSVFAVLAKLIVPLVVVILLFVSLMMTAGYLIQATAVEKENKVVEVLLSSANPDEIMAGKLIGLCAAGLLQVLVWFGMILAGGVAFAGALAAAGVEVPWLAMGVGLLFFVAGYLFLGSLMLGTGALGSNMRESQQASMIWTLLAVVPMMMLAILIEDPHGVVGQVLTWIPFTAPVTVLLRMTLAPAGIAWWEIVGSLAVLVASIWGGIRLGGRLFRVGLLLTGGRPKLREILRQARLAP